MNVNSLLEGASPYQSQQNEAAKLSGKWEKSGLLEGIQSSTEANNMAMLLENQAKQLVNEANSTGTGTSITAGGSEAWAGVALPLVRRVFGEIVAKDLVSVQPMNLPAGLIFYLDFQYGTANAGRTAGQSLYSADANDISKNTTTGGLYGAGQYAYSTNQTASAVAAIGDAAATLATYATASATFTGILNNDTETSKSLAAAGGFGVTAAAGTHIVQVATAGLVDLDVEALKSIEFSAASSFEGFFPQFTRIVGNNVEFVVSSSNIDNLGVVTINYSKGPDNLNDTGDFEEGKGGSTVGGTSNSSLAIPEINVQLQSDTVAAKTRKLKAQWTPEFAQDLNAYHSIDAEAELTSILSEYISMEIDLEILDMLIQNADTTDVWSAKVATETTDAGVASTATGVYYTKMSWFQTLGIKLQKVSNLIHQKTLRGGANFMVVSPKVSTILESIPGFAADSAGDGDKYAMGVQKIGAINSRYTVYKNPYLTENVILMGYKGSQFLETGAVFAPYIPLIMTPLVYDPASFTPRKGIMTRYAKKMVRPDFYGKILVRDLDVL